MLFHQSFCAINGDENENNKYSVMIAKSALAGAVATVCKLSAFGKLQAIFMPSGVERLCSEVTNSEDQYLTKVKYPYAQQWYNALVKKYPEAHFEQSNFLYKNISAAGASFDKIYLNEESVEKIENLCNPNENDVSSIGLLQETASLSEWMLLHESHHIKKNDYLNHTSLSFGGMVGVEGLYQFYKKRQPITPVGAKKITEKIWLAVKSLPKRLGIFAGMMVAGRVAAHYYSKNAESQADAFATKHADMGALHASALFFEEHQIKDECFRESDPLLFGIQNISDPHPTSASRAKSIRDEIDRREQLSPKK